MPVSVGAKSQNLPVTMETETTRNAENDFLRIPCQDYPAGLLSGLESLDYISGKGTDEFQKAWQLLCTFLGIYFVFSSEEMRFFVSYIDVQREREKERERDGDNSRV